MRARAIDEQHRASSPLELLFDLTFVVAIAQIVIQLAHDIADGHAAEGVVPYLLVFFAIWWAWMNFTWFASAFDTDDVLYRLLTMVQMAGVLLLAAGVPAAFNDLDYRASTIGYLVMRVGLVAQWVRAAIEDPDARPMAMRYVVGISVVQVGWLLRLVASAELSVVTFVVLAVLELLVPVWAARVGESNWHPHHIAERYGLFTIIVLGESVLAATTGVQASLDARGVSGELVLVAGAGLALLFALWWLYFLEPAGGGLQLNRTLAYFWGYGHYLVFAALAAVGAGLEVAVEAAGHALKASPLSIGYAIALPVGVFLILLWALHAPLVATLVIRPQLILPTAAVVLLLPLAGDFIGIPLVVAAIAGVCWALIALTVRDVDHRSRSPLEVSTEPTRT